MTLLKDSLLHPVHSSPPVRNAAGKLNLLAKVLVMGHCCSLRISEASGCSHLLEGFFICTNASKVS